MDQTKIKWPRGKRAVVSLTYDDGLPSHPREVASLLESFNLRGTFYAPIKSDLTSSPLVWRALVGRGHELGNHTYFHPCWSVGGKYADWLPEQFNLEKYDETRWLDEVKTANQSLGLVDGRDERTFGNTCWDNYIGPQNAPICLEPLIAQVFMAARGENTGKPVSLDPVNFNNLGTVWADHRGFETFLPELEEIQETGGWLIYTFHGVGEAAHNLHIDPEAHRRLLEYLHQHRGSIWTAPVIEVVKYLKK